jgi:hypothetical protein
VSKICKDIKKFLNSFTQSMHAACTFMKMYIKYIPPPPSLPFPMHFKCFHPQWARIMLGCVLILVSDIYAFLWLFAITFRGTRAFLVGVVRKWRPSTIYFSDLLSPLSQNLNITFVWRCHIIPDPGEGIKSWTSLTNDPVLHRINSHKMYSWRKRNEH